MTEWFRRTVLALAFAIIATKASACDPASFRVALDIGHYRAAPGAISATGVAEFDYNLALSRIVIATLRQNGFTGTFLIGESGQPLPLPERTRTAAANGAALFLSLHHDSVQPQFLSEWIISGRAQRYSDMFHGYAIFVSATTAQSAPSLRFATLLGQALLGQGLTPSLYHAEAIPGENRPLLDARLGIHRFDGLAVLRTATMPAVLLESAVIVNRAEEQAVAHGDYERRVAAAVGAAVGAFCHAGPGAAGRPGR